MPLALEVEKRLEVASSKHEDMADTCWHLLADGSSLLTPAGTTAGGGRAQSSTAVSTQQAAATPGSESPETGDQSPESRVQSPESRVPTPSPEHIRS